VLGRPMLGLRSSTKLPRVHSLLVIAADNGEGLLGETDDRVITFFSLGVVLFFTLVVITGSAIQSKLDKRKEAKKASKLRRTVGW
jgi:hypothetical protein